MDNNIHSYYLKGKKNFQMAMPSEICSIERMTVNRSADSKTLLVCLKNGAVRIYNDKSLVSHVETNVGASGILYGMYGREEGCLVINSMGGGMQAKIL